MPNQPTPEARQDYNALLEALIPFAEQMLKKHGEFYPFGAAVSAAGEIAMHAADEGTETPSPEDVIAGLTKGFQSEARNGTTRATAICYNGRMVQDGKKVDAVIVNLEHATGSASKACVPYSKSFFGKYRFGDVVASFDDPKIFATS